MELKMDKILDWYDGPLIFTAHYELDKYLCSFYDYDKVKFDTTYLCCRLTDEQLENYTQGRVDFLDTIKASDRLVFMVDCGNNTLIDTTLDQIEYLPEPGYFNDPTDQHKNDEFLKNID